MAPHINCLTWLVLIPIPKFCCPLPNPIQGLVFNLLYPYHTHSSTRCRDTSGHSQSLSPGLMTHRWAIKADVEKKPHTWVRLLVVGKAPSHSGSCWRWHLLSPVGERRLVLISQATCHASFMGLSRRKRGPDMWSFFLVFQLLNGNDAQLSPLESLEDA